jgi:MFS family permease
MKLRALIGVNLLWLPLSLLFDGLNSLVLPARLLEVVGDERQATVLGLLTFVGLFAAMLLQPLAGALSDRLRPRFGRLPFIGLGVALTLVGLVLFGLAAGPLAIAFAYLAVQLAASAAQAGQQGLIPDLVPRPRRGAASGVKGFMDLAGATVGFLILGQLLGRGTLTPALMAMAGALVAGYVLTLFLVDDARAAPAPSAPHSGPAAAFRLDPSQHRPFAYLVAARFFFLLGTYAIGRFLLLFVAERLGLAADEAAVQAGGLLAALGLVSLLFSPLAGWAADRVGRGLLMLLGAALSAAGALLLILSATAGQILIFGALLGIGSAAFASANWAMTADLVPRGKAARFFGLANFGTAGAVAAAGLFGPLVDWAERTATGAGYNALFVAAAGAFVVSAFFARRAARPAATSWAGVEGESVPSGPAAVSDFGSSSGLL